jgi:hypothetical protein
MKGIFIPFVGFSMLFVSTYGVSVAKAPEKLTLEMITEDNSTSVGDAQKNYKKDLETLLNQRKENVSDRKLRDTSFDVVESRHKKLKASADRERYRFNKFMKSYKAELKKEADYEKSLLVDYGQAGSELYGLKFEFLFEDGFDIENVSLDNKAKMFEIKTLLEEFEDLRVEINAFYYEDEDLDDKIINKAEAWDRGVVVKSFLTKNDIDFDFRLRPIVYSVSDDIDDAEEKIEFVILKR